MSNILVLNAGSTSLKYALFNRDLEHLASGTIREIGTLVRNHETAFQMMKEELNGEAEIDAVGHRIVHGGNKFVDPTVVTETELPLLEKYSELAPLHNPPGLACLRTSFKSFGPTVLNVAVFDTAFYKNLPAVATHYALPVELTSRYHIRRYGFHGLAHQSVAEQAARALGRPLRELDLITVHLGGGASITAIKRGEAVDTSMGFTPLEGLVMMTRCGDIDPAIPLYLQKVARLSAPQIYQLFNRESGMLALSGIKEGMIKIEEVARSGDQRARAALDFYVYRVRKYIGAYLAVLGRLDSLVFTGAIGEGSEYIRNLITHEFTLVKGVQVLHFPPEEERLIARQAVKFLEN